ncbi:PREDICTED: leishmanolysin-like peptidase [Amphimedon queenslandica]|uniref:Leishmanolysin-like peptidase n=1 Tax=Amphimedon queenslandica TaxID=400682 RepID=A0A1X7VEQ3_AMPQE|nr:PREDICTED: leishmanolysin-like peptidase [Amphimedon queenslandica]|eukprot:XP_011410372.1 PREDICTED: leishmanolysin-like peptidase [Amphimedon queenslandica]
MSSRSLLCLLVALLSLVFLSTAIKNREPYKCSHGSLPKHEIPRVHLADSDPITKRSVTGENFNQRFRIYVSYDDNFQTGGLTPLVQQSIRTIINNITSFYESVLTVRRTPSPIRLDQACTANLEILVPPGTPLRPCYYQCTNVTKCLTATIPPEHLLRCAQCYGSLDISNCNITGTDGPGVSNTDFVLYVTGVEENCGEGTIAYATSCQMEDQYDRPIAGVANFCPSVVNVFNDTDFIEAVAKHEILHALGFSSNLFPWFRFEDGSPRTERDAFGRPSIVNGAYVADENTVKVVNYTNWETRNGPINKTVSLMVTPNVVDVGRRHFNCSTLEGVQLEDQGGPATIATHWEKRVVENEAMTGYITVNPVFSNFTFALLEDSGWYKVDRSKASILVWGRGDGCGYTAGSCGGYISSKQQQSQPIAPFCDYLNHPDVTQYSCNVDRSAVGYCNLQIYNNTIIPAEYQYFNSGANFNRSAPLDNLGGFQFVADYCSYIEGSSQYVCSDPTNQPATNSLAQTYGTGSRCIEHSGTWQVTTNTGSLTLQNTAGCYQYTCSNSVVTVTILGQSYTCSYPGQVMEVDQMTNGNRYTGAIVCPSCVEICYDDFENCPEAAKLYGEIAIPPTTSTPTGPNSAGSVLPMIGLLLVAATSVLFINF